MLKNRMGGRQFLALAWALLPAACSRPPRDPQPITFAIYLVTPCGSRIASPPLQLDHTAESYCLERTPIVDQTGVTKAALSERRPSEVDLTLAGEASAHMLVASRKAIGKQAGFVLNGELKMVPIIKSPMGSSIAVDHLDPKDAALLAGRVNRGVLAAEPSVLPQGKPSDAPQGEPLVIGRTRNGYPIVSEAKVYSVGKGIPAPVLIHREDPEYTPRARAAGIQGSVTLEAVILPSGIPDSIRVVRPLDPGLDAKAIDCAKKYRYQPGQFGVRTTIEIEFKL